MLPSAEEQKLAATVSALVHQEKLCEAAKIFAEFCKLDIKLDDNPRAAYPVLQNYLHFLLNNGAMSEAAQLLWTPTQFNPNPQYTKDLWELFDYSNMGLIMGAASCSKSYGMGVRLFLEWIRDPKWTTIKVVGPSEDHLEQNLFSHLVGLHQKASLPMPGEIGELFIGVDRRNQASSIRGVIIPVGQRKKAGRLQGAKRIPRDKVHPLFGPLSRMFIFIDEVENVPGGIWSDVDNVLSNVDGESAAHPENSGLKLFAAFNPTDQTAEVGKRVEPPFGWEGFDMDKHFKWKSVRGWDVLRLDGEQSENVKLGKVIYPGLQTQIGLATIARNAGGRESSGYYSMGRGAYPPTGIELALIPPGMFQKSRAEYIWYDKPTPAVGADLALEGGANCIVTLGEYGRVSGIKMPPSLEFPQGQTVMFKDRMGQVTPRWGCQANQQFVMPKADTVKMAAQLVDLFKRARLKGENVCLDRTGHGQGVSDTIKHDWSAAIVAVNYSDGASATKIMSEDSLTCEELYDRVHTELWFALRAFFEYQYCVLAPTLDVTKLTQQVTQRKYKPMGKKSKLESKKDYVSRGFVSPDEADSLTLFVHACRKGSGVSLSMAGGVNNPEEDDEVWYEQLSRGGVRLDPTNRTDYLDVT